MQYFEAKYKARSKFAAPIRSTKQAAPNVQLRYATQSRLLQICSSDTQHKAGSSKYAAPIRSTKQAAPNGPTTRA